MGTIVAWILVRDRFRGQGVVNAIIDLPFALPTIVAGLTLLALYGPNGPGRHRTSPSPRTAVLLALLFVTLPFVIRTVQPVLLELDREMEEAAASLGAGPLRTFRHIVFPNLFPAILSGVALAFARAIGEFGSVVLISGNLPVQDRGRVRLHLRPHRERRPGGRGGGLGRDPRDLVRRPARDRRRCAAGRRGTTVHRWLLRFVGLSYLAGPARGAGRARLLAGVRARLRAGLGRGHDARGQARAST